MTTVSRALLATLLLALSLTGCDIFDKKKPPLTGERIAVFSDRREIEPDKEAGSIQVTLPAPVVNDSWPQSGGFANYAMQHLAIGDSPQVVWTADVGSGSSSSRILTTPPVVADGKVFAKDAESTVSAYSADTGKFDTVVARLDPLAMPDRPFHASVTELQALAAARKNDLKRARELWTAIVKDPASPQGAQQRAQAMLTYYGPGEGK